MFYVEHKEYVCYLLLTLGVKGLFSQINLLEYCLVSLIMFYHTYYTHAEIKEPFFLPLFIDSSFHKKHHTIGGGNYAILFNIWDKYMGTTIKKKKIV
jgi:sterol desaturase/sphingolipid hydroxylase (fatty acid hydroxylase superfamily)